MKRLRLALIHLDIRHKQPEHNREMLMTLAEEAARCGASIIIGPELALSGYSFEGRNDMSHYAETDTGPALTGLAEVTRRFGVYVCIGMAEKDARTGILYNSAFVLGPNGKPVCRYRKINAEGRWACPGDPRQDNTFETPWGCVGVLICSDSYHGLMPRVTALRGADLLLVPANWPPSGLDPREIWRARALENGFHLAACNRTGIDLTMDCRKAPSCIYGPGGETLLDGKNEDSHVFYIDLPLMSNERLENRFRLQHLADRRPQYYHDCYLNLRSVRDLTEFLNLPRPGDLNLYCIVPGENEHPMEALEQSLKLGSDVEGGLYLLPFFDYSDLALTRIARSAREKNIGIITCGPRGIGMKSLYTLQNKGEALKWDLPPWPFEKDTEIPRIDFGPARLLLVPYTALAHPELAVASAKQGCDLILASEKGISKEDRLLAGVRTIENLAMALCATNGAGIWITPEGHQRWEEVAAGPGEICHYELDTRRTRNKRFQDLIDFELLLRQPESTLG